MKKIFILLIYCSILSVSAQTIQGFFSQMAGTLIKFGTFQGLQSQIIDSVKVGADGSFQFTYQSNGAAIAYLISSENKPFFLILDKGENIVLTGQHLGFPESISVLRGSQNQAFSVYAQEHPRREQALSAWTYLESIYLTDSLFAIQKTPRNAILGEKKRIKKEEQDFLSGLNPKWYVTWYLPTRRLVSDVSTIAQYRTEDIPRTISAFRKLDYSDVRLYRSGLFKDAIESHFWLLENSGKTLDSVFIEMKVSIDSMFLNLIKDQKRLNEVTDYLFDLLEKHSLFQASEYLALKALNETSCTLNSDLAKQLETYRVMKKGNKAADIVFSSNLLTALSPKPKMLSDLNSPYTLVVFGASWCETCKEEVPKIAALYSKWKDKGVEVVFISLDENKQAFEQFAQPFPFISYCDFGKWNSPVATNYYVFGTPTMFLLDDNRTILLRPNSISQMDAWVDWYVKN